MNEPSDVCPVTRRLPVGLSQFATYVTSEPGDYDVSIHTKLQSSRREWTLTGIDVSLSSGGDLLQPLLRSLEADHPSHLLIVADTVRVTDAIKLPGVYVRIHARVLEFADGALINTQATAYTDAEIPSEAHAPGLNGRYSGPIELYVGEVNILGPANRPVIITDGTDGTIGGPGDEGMPGDEVIGINFDGSEGASIQRDVNTHRQWVKIRDLGLEISKTDAVVSVTVEPNTTVDDSRTIQHPDPKPNLNGRDPREDGPAPKRDETEQASTESDEDEKIYKRLPGKAGRGTIAAYINALSNVAVLLEKNGAFSMVSGKNAEPRSVKGGEPGHAYKHDDAERVTPVKAFELYTIHDSKLHAAAMSDRPDLRTPDIQTRMVIGSPGQVMKGEAAEALPDLKFGIASIYVIQEWFHPLHAEVFSAYLTDLSRGGFAAALHKALEDIESTLAPLREAYRKHLPDVDFDDDASQDAFQAAFDALNQDDVDRQAEQDAFPALVKVLNQITTMKDQADRGLDHYGNPAGWAPNLSFAAQMDLERGAGEHAVQALYVSQWLTSASDKVEALIQSHWEAILEVRKRRQMDFDRQGKMNQVLSQLTVKSERLQADITSMKGRLKDVTDELETEAENRVIWAATVDIVGSLMTVIPYGQPALGMAGKAVKSSSEYIGGKDGSADNILSDILDRGKTLGKKGLAKRSEHFKSQADKLEAKAKSAEGAKYWDKYKSDERKAFDDAQASEAQESRAAAKVPKARAAQWSAVADNFTDAAKDIYSDVKVLACPEDAAKDLLKQLEEKDDDFKQFSAEIEDLNQRKTLVVQEIIDAHVELGSIASDIAMTHHMEGIFIDALTDAALGRVNPMVLGAADQMKNHALEWLTRQRYNLVKAYEALFLEPCPVPKGAEEFGVNWLVEQIEKIDKTLEANADSDADRWTISDNNLKAIRGFLTEFSTSIARKIVDKIESDAGQSLLPIESPTPITIVLSPEQLAILNEGQKGPWDANPAPDGSEQDGAWPRTVTINLGDNSFFPFDHDKAVIRSITVRDQEVSERDGANTDNKGYRSASLVAYHFGNGILKSDNQLFAVRHDTARPNGASGDDLHSSAKWEFSYDESTQEMTAGGGYGGDVKGTIRALLGALTQDNSGLAASNFLSSLPAWTELMITATGDAAQWAQFDKLVLDVHIDAVDASHATSGIDLRMDDQSEWPVIVTRPDGSEENYMTPALILGEPDTTLTIRPERFYERDVVSIGGHTSDDNTWDLTFRRGEVFHMKMAKEVREPDTPLHPLLPPGRVGAPTQPLDWDQGAMTLMQAAKARLISRNEPVWNPHRALAYAYTFVDAYGDETGLSPWLTINPVKYCFTKLRLPVWPDGVNVADVKLYRRIRADAQHGGWSEIEEITAFNDRNGPANLMPQSSPIALAPHNGTYEFFDGNM